MLTALILLLPLAADAGGTVNNCTEAALRAAMADGGTVTFACDGTITLTSTITNALDTVLDASGHQVTISGRNSVRVFYVAPGVTFTLINLKIANGASSWGGPGSSDDTVKGAGIFNDNGTLSLLGCVFESNRATGVNGFSYHLTGEGGAIFNRAGVLSATSCSFSNNTVSLAITESAGPMAAQALGGAIRNSSGLTSLQDCYFSSNSAVGADGYRTGSIGSTPGLDGLGGAIYNSGTLTGNRCSFVRNLAQGGAGITPTYACVTAPPAYPSPAGTAAGSAGGGAIYNQGTLALQASTVMSNSATGGSGGSGGNGCGGGSPISYVTTDGGAGAAGGSGIGGAIFNGGSANLLNCTIAFNSGPGGAGGAGGAGGPSNQSIGGNGANGGNGGNGCGGIYGGTLNLINCTVAFNSGKLGPRGIGGVAGHGGFRDGQPGTNGSDGLVFGALGTDGSTLVNTLLATNTPVNASGAINDLGHNLSSDGSGAFSAPGSLTNADPKLGPLASNGGPTLTMALVAGSLAIDAGDTSAAPPTDQRGFPRPAGVAADIGAVEYGSVIPSLSVSRSGTSGLDITAYGNADRSCRLLTSTNLAYWVLIDTNQFTADGTVLFHTNFDPGGGCRFYRLVMP
jgi:hypothetical protein